MNLDIKLILGGKERELVFPISLDPTSGIFDEYLPDDVKLLSVGGEITVTDKGEYIVVDIAPLVEYEVPCSRCLAAVKDEFEFSFERIIPSGGTRFAVRDELCDEEDILTVVEGHVDVTDHICEEIALELPDYVLCSDDCPGLCPKCGKKLADGDCGCEKKKEIDPRMEIFKKLLGEEE